MTSAPAYRTESRSTEPVVGVRAAVLGCNLLVGDYLLRLVATLDLLS